MVKDVKYININTHTGRQFIFIKKCLNILFIYVEIKKYRIMKETFSYSKLILKLIILTKVWKKQMTDFP